MTEITMKIARSTYLDSKRQIATLAAENAALKQEIETLKKECAKNAQTETKTEKKGAK